MRSWDAIVVGGGHAGIEAARALAAMGQQTALLTLNAQKIGDMSCNPAIGGVAKSHLVFEIDALGGLMGAAADESAIQSRRLNMSRGPAVRSTRVQCDKARYARFQQRELGMFARLGIMQGEAAGLLIEAEKISGVRLSDGSILRARAVVVTAGTFMRGLMFCGEERMKGGRYGDSAADLLTQSILDCGHRIKRLKTGTPARLKAGSIDFAKLERQWGDAERRRFSWRNSPQRLPQLSCYITHTNERTHDILRANFDKSPLYSGDIQGVGPRYCPSIEDKIKRFSDRARHQIFLEPEGLDTDSIYPNGLSTCMPSDVQLSFLRSISGLEEVELLRPGYAVEYDTLDPTELQSSLMSRHVQGLWFAGQVNRSSGYEEAAAQGLWAGINAARYLKGETALQPDRSRSYMETLVDDLVSRGTEEPYRLFTSRSEYRLLLREDNANERLFSLSSELGILSDEQKQAYEKLLSGVASARKALSTKRVRLDQDRVISVFDYLRRPEVTWEQLDLADLENVSHETFSDLVVEKLEVEAKYAGYLHKQEGEVEELREVQAWSLVYDDGRLPQLPGLTREVVEKVLRQRPSNVAELASMSGIPPTAVLLIAREFGRRPRA